MDSDSTVIYRHHIAPPRAFTQFSHELIRHPRLSSDAARLLTWQLSLPDGAREPLSRTAERARIGACAFTRAKRQLKEEGFVHERRLQGPGGHWITQQLVSNVPLSDAEAAKILVRSNPDDPKGEGERSGKAVAADRMAAIIACSWPRAELTDLAHRHKPRMPDELAHAVSKCTTNQERARLVAEALLTHGATALDFTGAATKYSDRPAAQRMAGLVQNPRPVLNDVAGAFRIALRRLYRTRNIILHGGATQGVALEASLRTAAPLAGAGLDRIIHADYVEGLDPLALAARADVALPLVNGETGLSVVDLLEPG
ncbi:hypothetical protein ROS62_25815 [Streptomyces sp. DSM 41972]|uniref:Uncharacterized protein n=1 Tax=Streptomyces althioticus subsp. attaecolombicae TaxID=3075534 RepID=A0ABU3I573_9ACTN|nr:hypothetical protein [Streptomyces sp. DSM 41972]SCD81389.1 hypothetical protein GA0115238_126414 [Streptomyces sp. di50b]SCE14829.1 hypothetical protein GA0115245_123314 [Streptomyces sp. di188]